MSKEKSLDELYDKALGKSKKRLTIGSRVEFATATGTVRGVVRSAPYRRNGEVIVDVKPTAELDLRFSSRFVRVPSAGGTIAVSMQRLKGGAHGYKKTKKPGGVHGITTGSWVSASRMRCPSAKSLTEAFRDLSSADAHAIRKLCKTVDDPDALEELIDENHPKTEAYVHQMHSSPYNSRMWRRTVVLDAINHLLDGFGVEPLGPVGTSGPPYEFINFGDTYVNTLIYKKDTDRLFIGSWGDIAEKHPKWE